MRLAVIHEFCFSSSTIPDLKVEICSTYPCRSAACVYFVAMLFVFIACFIFLIRNASCAAIVVGHLGAFHCFVFAICKIAHCTAYEIAAIKLLRSFESENFEISVYSKFFSVCGLIESYYMGYSYVGRKCV